MNDGDTLLRAILANPVADDPRLMYADWLKEHGEHRGHQRGEYIRYQLSYGWHEEHNDGNKFGGDTDCEYQLSSGVWPFEEWPDSIYNLLELEKRVAPNGTYRWRRGFIDRIELPCAEFMKHAPALFAAHPITSVVLDGREPLDNGAGGNVLATFWCWIRAYKDDDLRRLIRWEVPYELGDDMPSDFASADAAYEWLSGKAVSFGRAQAGLPPLPIATEPTEAAV